MLGLPEGFVVDEVYMERGRSGIQVRIRCPQEPEYQVNTGELIPEIKAVGKLTTKEAMAISDQGKRVVWWWPDLGQVGPGEEEVSRIFQYQSQQGKPEG
jgi:hypothetical protein